MIDSNVLPTSGTKPTPYRSGYLVDKINMDPYLPQSLLHQTEDIMRSLVESFNWLVMATRLDIAMINNALRQYLRPCPNIVNKIQLNIILKPKSTSTPTTFNLKFVDQLQLQHMYILKIYMA